MYNINLYSINLLFRLNMTLHLIKEPYLCVLYIYRVSLDALLIYFIIKISKLNNNFM